MIISDLSVLETVEESSNIQGGTSAPLFLSFNGVSFPIQPTNNAFATGLAQANNPFSTGSVIGVSVSNAIVQTQAITALGGGSQAQSLSAASISFVPGPNGAPLLLPVPLTVTNF